MLKIAITGTSGLIASRIIELLRNEFEFIQLDLPNFDVTDKDKTIEIIKGLNFDIFFHLAAYTNVDGAETEKKIAHLINVEGTKNVLDAVSEKKKKLIFVSTDFVFDGKGGPYFEDSSPNPIGYYAQTKLEGEQIVKNRAMIVRYSYPYRANHPSKPDFVKRIKSLLEDNKPIKLMSDVLITPTFIDDIAFAMKHLFNNFAPEIYHIVGSNSLSSLNAGKLIAKTFNLNNALVLPTTHADYSKGKATRSQYSDIKTKKNDFYKMKTFEEGLAEVVKQLQI